MCSSSLAQTDASPQFLQMVWGQPLRGHGPGCIYSTILNNSRGFFKAFFIKYAIIFSLKIPEIDNKHKF